MTKNVSKYHAVHRRKHKEVYSKIKEEWEEFERKYWKKHPEEKYCHICGEKKHVELHHIVPRHVDQSKIFDEDNLIPLCRACHFRWGHLCNYETYNPNIKEDAQTLQKLFVKRKEEYKEIANDTQ